jgi:hypothetical protein
MTAIDPLTHWVAIDAIHQLAMYMPPARRARDKALADDLAGRDELTDGQRRDLVAAVLAYAHSLPLALLDPDQSVVFETALRWAGMNSDTSGDDGSDTGQPTIMFAPLRQRAVAAEAEAPEYHHVGRFTGTATVPVPAAPQPPEDQATEDQATKDQATKEPTTKEPTTDRPTGDPPTAPPTAVEAPGRHLVEANRVLVAQALRSIVKYAAADKQADNDELLRVVAETAPPIEDGSWERVALVAGVYARILPVPQMSRREVNRLWDSIRWAIWYEYWFSGARLAGRINQLVSLLQRIPTVDAEQLLERTTPEMLTIIKIAKAKALVELATYLESTALTSDAVRGLRQVALDRRATIGYDADPAAADASPTAAVPPASVPARLRAMLATRLSREEAADALESVWGYLDPQLDAPNRDKLQRARRGEARQLADLIPHALQSAEWRLRQRRSTVTEDDVRTLAHLALFVAGNANDSAGGPLRAVGLYGLYLIRFGTLGAEGYAQLIATLREDSPELVGRAVTAALDETVAHLDSTRAGLMAAWTVVAASWTTLADPAVLARFVAALDRAGAPESVDLLLLRRSVQPPEEEPDNGLSFLPAADRAAFEEHYRKGRVYGIAELLGEHEAAILETLSRALATPSFSQYRPPARTVVLNQGGTNRFPTLRRKALSGDAADASEARDALGRASADRKEWERRILREWRVYATMQVDMFQAIKEWREAFDTKTASLEEQWNLSVFHAGQREYIKALTYDRQIWKDSIVGTKSGHPGQLPPYKSIYADWSSNKPDWMPAFVALVRSQLDQAKAITNHLYGLQQFVIGKPIWETYLKGEEADPKVAMQKVVDAVHAEMKKG